MAASAITDYIDGLLKRVYSEDVFDWMLNQAAPFWMKLQSAKLIGSEIGDGYYWPFKMASAQNISTPAESGNVPVNKPATVVQGRVRLAQFIGGIEMSWLLEAVGQGKGAWKNVLKEEMNGAMDDITKHLNRIYAASYGTGKIVTNNATVTATSVVGKLPFGSLLARKNMRLEQYDADTSGAIVGTAFQVSKIVDPTRTITVSASQTFTANYGLYMQGAYGNAPNGIAGLVDDGTNLTTLHNVSRSTYEEMKSVVYSNSGTPRQLTEDMPIQAALDVRQKSGSSIDTLVANTGLIQKWLALTRPDRRYEVSGSGVPKYDQGYDELHFVYGGKRCPVVLCEDISPRTLYGLSMSEIRRVGDSSIKWMNLGNGIFVQGVDSGGYKTTKQATIAFFSNIATYKPNAHFRIDDLSDPQLCGATRGGTDV